MGLHIYQDLLSQAYTHSQAGEMAQPAKRLLSLHDLSSISGHPHGREREPVPASSPLIPKCVLWHKCTHSRKSISTVKINLERILRGQRVIPTLTMESVAGGGEEPSITLAI